MDHQPGVADKGEKGVGHCGEGRLVGEKRGAQPVHGFGLGRHVAFGVDVSWKVRPVGMWLTSSTAADLDDAVAAQRVETGGLGVEHDLAHHPGAPDQFPDDI